MRYFTLALFLLTAIPAHAEIQFATEVGYLADEITQSEVEPMDFNKNGIIEPGPEAHAVLRYVNHPIFRKYDLDHNGQIEGAEAERYVKEEVQTKLDKVHEFYKISAYSLADKRFAKGVSVSDPEAVKRTAPPAPLFDKIALSVSYSNKGEAGKDVEAISTGFEYKWKATAVHGVPIVFGTKVSYEKENTFLPAATNKVSRWTVEPVRITLGTNVWKLQPTIGLGYGRSETTALTVGDPPMESDANEFVWDIGFAYPIYSDWIKLTTTKTIRLDNFSSDKKSDDIKLGVEFDLQKLLDFPK